MYSVHCVCVCECTVYIVPTVYYHSVTGEEVINRKLSMWNGRIQESGCRRVPAPRITPLQVEVFLPKSGDE